MTDTMINDKPRQLREQLRGVESTCMRGVLMNKRTCSIDGCDRTLRARGWCTLHYTRWRKFGDPGTAEVRPRKNPETCKVEGCERRYCGHGYCSVHMRRWKKTGDPGPVDTSAKKRGTCSFDGCTKTTSSYGLCGGHYQQRVKGVELTPLRFTQKSTTRDSEGRKRCSTCTEWKVEDDFYPVSRMADGLNSYCKRCDRSLRLTRNYGITADQYDDMLAAQGGVCAICGDPAKDGGSLHVDHDHSCCSTYKKSCGKCVRGLLCEDCNRVLGTFKDDVKRFNSAITYLQNGGVRHE